MKPKLSTVLFVSILLVLILPKISLAVEDIYICQNSAGSADGSSCNNCRSVSWFNTETNWANPKQQRKIGPGDTVHLCGIISSSLILQGGGNSDSPITILFEKDSKLSAPYWEDVLWGRRAAILSRGNDYIIIDGGVNGVIEATDSGTTINYGGTKSYNYNNNGIIIYNSNNWEVRNLTIQNLYQRIPLSGDSDGGGTGIYAWYGSNFSIYNNKISDTASGIVFSYCGSSHVRIYNNTISRISGGIKVGSSNVNCGADDVLVYNNDISDGYVWDGIWSGCTGDCWYHNDGIQAWRHFGSYLTNFKIYNNYIHGDWGNHNTGYIYISEQDDGQEVFNNLLIPSNLNSPTNGFIVLAGGGKVYENTVVGQGNGICIRAGGNLSVLNNIFYNCDDGASISEDAFVNQFDYNLYYFSDNPLFSRYDQHGTDHFVESLNGWQSSTGFDIHSIIADPRFIDSLNNNYHLMSSSPAIDKGTILPNSFAVDKDGISRPQGCCWDIGAYEYVQPASPPDNIPPAAPRGLTVI